MTWFIIIIADALSQNCSLMELTISTHDLNILGWTKLFESLHKNTTLNTLDCKKADLQELESNNEVAKSVCEMLTDNQGLQNLNIDDEFIKGHLKEFAMAYIQRKTVLNLTVGQLEDDLAKEIEELETDTDRSTTSKTETNHHCTFRDCYHYNASSILCFAQLSVIKDVR